ncbi:MAG: hypothetical protein ACJ75B_20465 [Flavisolibacter sp.]
MPTRSFGLKKTGRLNPAFGKHLFMLTFLLTSVLMACGQDHAPNKGSIQPAGTVNMKQLHQKEKKAHSDSCKSKFETGPIQNTHSNELPVPPNANVKKTNITPGQMKPQSTKGKNKKKGTSGENKQ